MAALATSEGLEEQREGFGMLSSAAAVVRAAISFGRFRGSTFALHGRLPEIFMPALRRSEGLEEQREGFNGPSEGIGPEGFSPLTLEDFFSTVGSDPQAEFVAIPVIDIPFGPLPESAMAGRQRLPEIFSLPAAVVRAAISFGRFRGSTFALHGRLPEIFMPALRRSEGLEEQREGFNGPNEEIGPKGFSPLTLEDFFSTVGSDPQAEFVAIPVIDIPFGPLPGSAMAGRQRLPEIFSLPAAVVRAAISGNRNWMESIQFQVEEPIQDDVDIESGEEVRSPVLDQTGEGLRSPVLNQVSDPLSKLGEIVLGITGPSTLVSLLPTDIFPPSPAKYALVGLNGMGSLFSMTAVCLREKKPVASRILAKLGALAAIGGITVLLGRLLPPNIQFITWVAAIIPATVVGVI